MAARPLSVQRSIERNACYAELSTPLVAARVGWQGGNPRSLDSGDVYFMPDAAREVARVFMVPVQLESCFKAVTDTFTCAELGFGSGLNFAVLAERFCALAPATARMHFISVEAAPFGPIDTAKMAAKWGADLPLLAELQDQYPPLLTGWHRLHLRAGRLCLSLYFGTATDALADLAGRQRRGIDHWLLDGFAPSVNPEMWQPKLFSQLAGLTNPGASVATFTAVGQVRRDLSAAGFTMRRVDQMPHKLHSLAGVFASTKLRVVKPPRQVNVLGAGIAGACVARSLADRGIEVRVIEPAGTIARYASRIPVASLHGRLLADGSAAAAWQVHSYHYSHRRLQALRSITEQSARQWGYSATGVLQLPGPNTSLLRLEQLLEAYAASGNWITHTDANVPTDESASADALLIEQWRGGREGLVFAIGGSVNGPRLCRALLNHPRISLCESVPEDRAPWVLANGLQSRTDPRAAYLELTALPGQAELCSHPAPPPLPILADGYVAPCHNGLVVGSTYEYRPWSQAQARTANLARWPDLGRHRGSFRASRTISSDRLPVVGALFDVAGAQIDDVYVVTGFGSAGMAGAPLAGEMVAAEIAGEFAPVTRAIATALSSKRFRERQQRRGPRLGAQIS